MSNIADAWTQHLRLAILRATSDTPGQAAHESLLVDLVNAVSIYADRDQVRGAIQWLHDNGLLVARVTHGALAATLTERGEWVASGRTSYPGVKKRNPMASVGDTTRLALDGLKD